MGLHHLIAHLTLPRLLCYLLSVLVGLGGVPWSPSVWAAADPEFSIQPYLQEAVERVTRFQLDNGMTFIVMERHRAPVISFVTYADVGGVDEDKGKTGVAHFLEHLAFKGTSQIGSLNDEVEQELLEALEQVFVALEQTEDEEERQRLQTTFDQLQEQASQYVDREAFGRIVEQAGGVGLNAATSKDSTRYFYSFPANKLELWMSLESERFLDPVFREFYEEREVILEERHSRVDNSPIGRLIEEMQQEAFRVHPYGFPLIGLEQDLRTLTPTDVREFFETYYVPSNLTFAIVGDVDPEAVQRLAEIYFGRYPKGEDPPTVTEVEPEQEEMRELTLRLPTEPWYLEAYHRPAIDHPDDPVYDVISSLLSSGRTSRLYQALVETGIALGVQSNASFPNNKYPNLVLIYGLTAPGHTVDEVAEAIHGQLEQLQTEPVEPQELERVISRAQAGLIRVLDSNSGMARLLAEFEVKTGDWRNLFTQIQQLEAITPDQIQQVAEQTFRAENRTVGRLLTAEDEG